MKEKYSIAPLLGAILAVLFFLYWINRKAVDTAASEVFQALFIGLKILFFAGLFLGVAYVIVHIRNHARLIKPTQHGHVQAVKHRGEWLQLNSAIPVAQQLDPAQQLAMLKTVMQLQGQMGQLARRSVSEVQGDGETLQQLPPPLPTNVRYEDVRNQVPKGHFLVGIGRLGIETIARAIGACVWIVGLSGTGKTSTTVVRVEERAALGHRFMGVDPHWFKPDSLSNAVTSYRSRFILPMAKTVEEANAVYRAFINEFKARKAGKIPQPWQPLTLLSDEVGAQADTTDDLEKENLDLLKSIVRICGQEARNFEMGGIFISQQATGLSWLRKAALMVIVHQLLMQSEKELAVNDDKIAVEEMKSWPIGRTYVYGVGFTDGPRTVQQPYFEAHDVVEADPYPSSAHLPHGFQPTGQRETEALPEVNGEADGSDRNENNGISDLSTIKKLREIGKRLKAGETKADIVKSFGLPYGRATQEISAVVDMVAEEIEAEG